MRISNRKAKTFAILSAAATVAVAVQSSQGQLHTWNNPGGGNWNNGANWIGGTPASLVTTQVFFNATGIQNYTATQDIANPFILNRMTFNNTGTGIITINGNPLSFQGASPAIVQNGSGAATIATAINVGAGTVDMIGTGAGSLNISGAVTGTANPGDGGVLNNNRANGITTLSGGATLHGLRQETGNLRITGGTYTLASTNRENDLLGGTPGVWSLGVRNGTFHQSGGTINAAQGFFSINEGDVSAATFSNGAVANFDPVVANAQGRFGWNAGSGTLNILSGAQINLRLAEWGRQITGSNPFLQINIDGTNSRVESSQQAVFPRGNWDGAMSITGGGVHNVVGNTFIATNAGALGDPLPGIINVNISGAGSRLTTTGQLAISTGGGTGTVTIGTGGFADGLNTFIGNGGVAGGGAGTIHINGGSFENRAQLLPESPLTPSAIRISSGSLLMNGAGGGTFVNAFASTNPGDHGLYSVSGANASFIQTGASTFMFLTTGVGTNVGTGGTSTLSVSNGGLAQIGTGFLDAAATQGATATVSVDGAGSRLVIGNAGVGSGDFILADDLNARGTGSITNGASLSVGRSLFLATTSADGATPGVATMTVNNSGVAVARALVMSGGNFGTLGDPLPAGQSVLNVTGGGTMTAQNGFIATNPFGQSTLTVSGTNSLLTIDNGAGTGEFAVADGASSQGRVTVSSGGRINVVGNSFVGGTAGATLATVDVNGGSWTNSGQLQIGGAGGTVGIASTVSVSGGGRVTASGNPNSLMVVYSTSTLNIGSGTSPGTVQVGTIGSFVDGFVRYDSGTFNTTGTLGVAGQVRLSSAARTPAGVPTNKKVLEAGTMEFDTYQNLGTPTARVTVGVVDLDDNDAIFKNNVVGGNGTFDVAMMVRSGRNGGAWNGAGIVSTAAKNASPQNKGLGVIRGSESAQAQGAATFNGRTVVAGDTLVKFTYNGDATFDGRITFDDYAKIDTGFNAGRTGWFNGDFNYDGVVNFDDYALIDQAFLTQGSVVLSRQGGLAGDTSGVGSVIEGISLADHTLSTEGLAHVDQALAIGHADKVGMIDGGTGSPALRAVPEPGAITLVGAGMLGLLARRRRSR